MFGTTITHPSQWRENTDGRLMGHQVEIAEGA